MNEQERKNKKLLLSIVSVAIVMVALVGVTYAFFNYTRTGGSNIVRTGQINFSSTQQTINLTNAFPIRINPQEGVPSNNANVGVATINITGDTTYSEGVEYLVSAVDVSNTVGAKTLPISIDVSVTSNTSNSPSTTLGSADEDYFTHHGSSANTSIYKVLAGETISNNDELLVGYIKAGETGVDGNVVIKAYIDASRAAISDTYNETTPETDQYGTTTNWVDNRTVFTTSEWNSLQSNGVSFKIKVESNEGIWVEDPTPPAIPTIEGCSGCKFMYTTNKYVFGGPNNEFNINNGKTVTLVSDIEQAETVTTDYRTLNSNIFLGFTEVDDGNGNMVVDKAYACGIKQGEPNGGTPFCLEGFTYETEDASTIYAGNVSRITGSALWDDSSLLDECTELDGGVLCHGTVSTEFYDGGWSTVKLQNNECDIDGNWGTFSCTEE